MRVVIVSPGTRRENTLVSGLKQESGRMCRKRSFGANFFINNEKLSSVLGVNIHWHRYLSITVGGKKELGLFITTDYCVLPITIQGKSRSNTCVCTSIPVSKTVTYDIG